jgi:hypothetical protein
VIRAFARTPWFVRSFLGLDPMQSLPRANGSFGVKLLSSGAANGCGARELAPSRQRLLALSYYVLQEGLKLYWPQIFL